MLKSKPALYWEKKGEEMVMELFQYVYRAVPAYGKFLRSNGVDTGKVKSYKDFLQVPPVSKKNYLSRYSAQQVSLDGTLNRPLVYTSTSGSTGSPFYFHRSFELDKKTSAIHELFFLHGGYKKDEPALVVVCFGMGVWIGGLITYQAFRIMQENGYNLSIITPGINKQEIFKVLKSVAPAFKNVILVGYPPFIKDIVDQAPAEGIDWGKIKPRFIFAAESFTENFRDYVAKKAAVRNIFLDTLNIYGTAELGAMAFETPLCILLRRLCMENKKLFEHIFGDIRKTPTLAQYIPSFIAFDSDNGNILVTGSNTIPLIRYQLGDRGGVYTFKDLTKHFKEFSIDVKSEAKKAKIGAYLYQLPFVYIHERDDLSTNLYGLQIYPEPIREALLHKPICSYLTGKFVLETKFDEKQDQYFIINLELQNGQKVTSLIKKLTLDLIVKNLKQKNSEYAELNKFLGKRSLPKLSFWAAGDTQYFKPGVKQKWVKK